MVRMKKEAGTSSNHANANPSVRALRNGEIRADASPGNSQQQDGEQEEENEVVLRRSLRSRYLTLKNLICGEREDISLSDSDKFKTLIDEVESLHRRVQKPREQVADAEALLDITSSFVTSLKAQRNDRITPSDFVTCLLRDFGQQDTATSSADGGRNLILWKDIGLAVSHILRKGKGCSTMLGPMIAELKTRKLAVRRKHVKPAETARPEKLNSNTEEKTDTDKNMTTMFNVLRKNRRVRLENLVLNRSSFAQTVENLFALSFLVKDGRAEITADKTGHFVSPRNAPAAEAIASGRVSYSHFVFRFDFKDWKLILDSVKDGEELMPHRVQADTSAYSDYREDPAPIEPESAEAAAPTTPIRKLSRNRGLILQEQMMIVEDSPEAESDDSSRTRAAYIRKGKRKLDVI